MTGLDDLDAGGLRDRLKAFDRAVALLHPGRSFELVLVGAGALVLIGCLDRMTADLDALHFPTELVNLMAQYDLSGQVLAHQFTFAEGLRDRLVPIEIGHRAVACYSASVEDVVISKLHSPRVKDAIDIRSPQLLQMLDWDRLDSIAGEMERNQYFERCHKGFKASYEHYREECRPCDN